MSDHSTFLNLVRGNRLTAYLGLQMEENIPFRWGKDYAYVEIPLGEIYNPGEEEVVAAGKRMQFLKLIPACKIEAREYRVLVTVNPRIHEYAQAPSMFLVEPNSHEQPSFVTTLRKDTDFSEFRGTGWLVRLYMLS